MLQFCSIVGGAIALAPLAMTAILVAAVVAVKVYGFVRFMAEYGYFEPYFRDDMYDVDIVLPDGKHLYSCREKE